MTSTLFRMAALVALSLGALLVAGCRSAEGETAADKRAYVVAMRTETLARLNREKPEASAKINGAAGYGVFSSLGMKLMLASSNGFGVVHDNAVGSDTYMSMKELGLGIGLGVKDTRLVIIFHDAGAMKTFTESGWQWGGDADASAQKGSQGSSASLGADVVGPMEVYVLTESGIALQATVTGTKYWKDEELNKQ